jgi:hypothetical protein
VRIAQDEGVSHPLASLLRSSGYDADSAKELGRLSLADVQVLVQAVLSGQTIVTHDKSDFRMLHEAWITWRRRWTEEVVRATGLPIALSGHAGILIVPLLPNHALARIIEPFVDTHDSIPDRLFAWSTAKGWHELIVP